MNSLRQPISAFLRSASIILFVALNLTASALFAQTELLISEYVEGTSFNKAVEIFNPTAGAIDLTVGQYRLELYSNGSATVSQSVALAGTIAAGDVWVVSRTDASATILAQADQLSNTVVNWNGDDAVVLRKGGAAGPIVDAFGQVGVDPGAEWGTGLTSTADNTLRRKSTICAGDTTASDAFDPSIQWDGFAVNTFDGIGAHTAVCESAPTVSSTTPANGQTSVAVNSDLTVTFSENVNVAGTWVTLTCGAVSQAVTVSGGPLSYTVNPDADLPFGAACTATVLAANVADQDVTDPPDTMAADYTWSFSTATPLPALSINDVTFVEGDAGTTTFTFTVTLAAPAGAGGVTFDIATADGTATAPADYTASSLLGQTIPMGSSTYTFDVLVIGETDVEPNETFFVNVTNVTGATVTDGQGQASITNDDYPAYLIHELQGSGAATPFPGQVVRTSGIVTGKKTNGFFLQEPDASADAVPATSEGIFIFTSGAPTVTVGDAVSVLGTVVEFNDLTEITGPTISVTSSGNALPTPITLTSAMISSSMTAAQIGATLESLEGMLVTAALTTNSPTTNNFGETWTFFTGSPRPVREAGIPVSTTPPPGAPAGIPRFDENPERIMIDTNGLAGQPAIRYNALVDLGTVAGPLDYNFGDYKIDITNPPANSGTYQGVRAGTAGELTIASFNIENFGPGLGAALYDEKIIKGAQVVVNVLNMPDVVGMVEVEDIAALQALRDAVNVLAGAANPQYEAYLMEANNTDLDNDQDVGFLVKTSRITGISTARYGETLTFINPNTGASEIVFDRPPFGLTGTVQASPGAPPYAFEILVNHLRSLSGIDAETTPAGDPDGPRVRAKRAAGAAALANIIEARRAINPNIIAVGDMNAFQFNDGYVDVTGTIIGAPAPAAEVTLATNDEIDPNLVDLVTTLPFPEQYSFMFQDHPQVLDHVIVTADVNASVALFDIAHFNADFLDAFETDTTRPEKVSDHDSAVVYITLPEALDLAVLKTGPATAVAGTQLSYTITVANPGPLSAINVAWSDALPAGTTFVSLSSPGGWLCTTPAVGTNGTVTCSVPTLGGSSSDFTIVIALDPAIANASMLSNAVTITSDTIDPNPANNTATLVTAISTSADLSITKVDTPDPVTPGTNLTYTITVANAGPSAAATVALADTLPASTTFVSLSVPAGWNCTTPAVGAVGTVTCSAATFGVSSAVVTVTVEVDATVAAGTVITNTASVNSATTDPVAANGTATATTLVVSPALLAATKAASGSFVPGDEVIYTIVLSNNGTSTQMDNAGDEFTDLLPSQLDLVSATATGGTATAVVATNTVTWNGSIAAGGAVTITIRATIDPATAPGTTVANQGTASYDADGNGSNESTVLTDAASAPGTADPTTFTVAAAAAPVPTLSTWALIALAMGLAAFGALKIRA